MGMGGATGTGRGASLADVVADVADKFGFKLHVVRFQHPRSPKKTAYELELPNGVLYVDGRQGRVNSSWLDRLPSGITLVHAAYCGLDFYQDNAARDFMTATLKANGIPGKNVFGDNWTSVSKDIVFPFVEARISNKANLPYVIEQFVTISEHIRTARENYISELKKF